MVPVSTQKLPLRFALIHKQQLLAVWPRWFPKDLTRDCEQVRLQGFNVRQATHDLIFGPVHQLADVSAARVEASVELVWKLATEEEFLHQKGADFRKICNPFTDQVVDPLH